MVGRTISGTLVSWSITVNSSAPSFVLQNGAPMDQNADGTSDENPLTTPFTGTDAGRRLRGPHAAAIGADHLWSQPAFNP